MTHTGGFARAPYEEEYAELMAICGVANLISCCRASVICMS